MYGPAIATDHVLAIDLAPGMVAALAARAGAAGLANLVAEVGNKMVAPVQPEPRSGSDNSNYEDTVAEQKRTMADMRTISEEIERHLALIPLICQGAADGGPIDGPGAVL